MALHKCKSMSVCISIEKERKICLKVLSLPGGGREIFHDSLKFSILDADEQKLLSNFSNIPMESGKMVRSGSSQEELLETAYKVGICSSKKNTTTGLGWTGPTSFFPPSCRWTTPPAAISSGMPTPGGRNIWSVHMGLDNKCVCWTFCSGRG